MLARYHSIIFELLEEKIFCNFSNYHSVIKYKYINIYLTF